MANPAPPPIRDLGGRQAGNVPVYHIHGLRQFMGTCRLHMRPDCRHLTHWTPERHRGEPLAKEIMCDWRERYEDVPERSRCRTCFKIQSVEPGTQRRKHA
jgi:hypothetical protein